MRQRCVLCVEGRLIGFFGLLLARVLLPVGSGCWVFCFVGVIHRLGFVGYGWSYGFFFAGGCRVWFVVCFGGGFILCLAMCYFWVVAFISSCVVIFLSGGSYFVGGWWVWLFFFLAMLRHFRG